MTNYESLSGKRVCVCEISVVVGYVVLYRSQHNGNVL